MWEDAIQALTELLTPDRLVFVLLGVALGMFIGLLPGMGGIVGMSILLPFVFGMDPVPGMGLLIGMIAVQHTADTFASVLLGVPGSSGSQATIMDGYPMAKQGQAKRALSVAFICSLFGGIIGAIALLLAIPIARPLVLALGSPELFMLTLLGLSMVAMLSAKSIRLAGMSVVAGLLVGTIGSAPTVAAYRYTFDTLYLYDGIPIAVVALGLFAVPEMVNLLVQKRSITESSELSGSYLSGLKDVIKHKFLVFRSSIIGVFVGFVPGLGGSVVDWIAYGAAKRTSKNNENFGKGDVRGIIGPESANNAKEGGTLIPTLMFGIPGSGTTAILLAGLIFLGVQPGPSMVDEQTPLLLSIVWTLALANVIGAAACLLLSSQVARVTMIPAVRLVPVLLVIMLIGAYQSSLSWGDLIAFVVIGAIGCGLYRFGWPRPPFLIGFVLAPSVERYLTLSVTHYGMDWITRPVVLIIGAVILLILLGNIGLPSKKRSKVLGGTNTLDQEMAVAQSTTQRESDVGSENVPTKAEPKLFSEERGSQEVTGDDNAESPSDEISLEKQGTGVSAGQLWFTFGSLSLFGFSLFLAFDFPDRALYLPAFAAALGFVLAASVFAGDVRHAVRKGIERESRQSVLLVGRYLAWIVAYLLVMALGGLMVATALFLITFLRIEARLRWWVIGIIVLAVLGALYGLSFGLSLNWPAALIG